MNQKYELSHGYTINRVINGTWQLSQGHNLVGHLDFDDVMRGFHMLVDQGFTTFDTGDIYTGSEEFIGRFVAELKRDGSYSPESIQVHTKYVPDINLLKDVDFAFTEHIIDRSLKRLNRDILDLVQFHWWDYDVPGCVDTAGYLCRLQEKGKIRNIGVTNFDATHLAALIDAGIPVVSCQSQYSVFDRRIEVELRDYCQAHGVRMICYGTMAGGFLSERWMGQALQTPETRSQVKYKQVIDDTLGWDGYQKLLVLLKRIGDAHGVDIANVATQFILRQANVAAAIVGIRNSAHVKANSRIFSFDLTDEEMAEIRGFVEMYPMLSGTPFELERTPGSKYRNIMKMNLNEEEQKGS